MLKLGTGLSLFLGFFSVVGFFFLIYFSIFLSFLLKHWPLKPDLSFLQFPPSYLIGEKHLGTKDRASAPASNPKNPCAGVQQDKAPSVTHANGKPVRHKQEQTLMYFSSCFGIIFGQWIWSHTTLQCRMAALIWGFLGDAFLYTRPLF